MEMIINALILHSQSILNWYAGGLLVIPVSIELYTK